MSSPPSLGPQNRRTIASAIDSTTLVDVPDVLNVSTQGSTKNRTKKVRGPKRPYLNQRPYLNCVNCVWRKVSCDRVSVQSTVAKACFLAYNVHPKRRPRCTRCVQRGDSCKYDFGNIPSLDLSAQSGGTSRLRLASVGMRV